VAVVIRDALDASVLYRLWQRPFANRKFAPVARAIADDPPRSVLDIGCGPGTNAAFFERSAYLGVDLNPNYVETARRRFGDRFVVADVTREVPERGAPYDFVLLNSLMHHLDDDGVEAVLTAAAGLLAADGELHILDLELPAERSAARFLALQDRGDYPRPREEWRRLIARSVEIHHFEPYPLGVGGWALWRMFYCRAGRSTSA
jgi:SAM-dependent methyltransferase